MMSLLAFFRESSGNDEVPRKSERLGKRGDGKGVCFTHDGVVVSVRRFLGEAG